MRRCCLIFTLLSAFVLRAETVPHYVVGDMDNSGTITQTDVSLLAEACVGKTALQQGTIVNGAISMSEVEAYVPSAAQTTFLNGDLTHDGKITAADVVWLIAIVRQAKDMQYAIVRDGKIVYAHKNGISFIIEEEDFIDDGEEDFSPQ